MASKQQEAKERQNYQPKPVAKVCMNCVHFHSEIEVREEYFGSWEKEKNIRCELGGFAVKKTATCNEYKKLDD